MGDLKEKDIKWMFVLEWLGNFEKLINSPIRLYSMEFPVIYGKEEYSADILLEVPDTIPMDNQLYVLEFKRNKILHSALDQLNLYCSVIGKKLYRKKEVIGILAAPDFSDWEAEECKRQKRFCLQYNLNGSMRFL